MLLRPAAIGVSHPNPFHAAQLLNRLIGDGFLEAHLVKLGGDSKPRFRIAHKRGLTQDPRRRVGPARRKSVHADSLFSAPRDETIVTGEHIHRPVSDLGAGTEHEQRHCRDRHLRHALLVVEADRLRLLFDDRMLDIDVAEAVAELGDEGVVLGHVK